jgi:peptidoglycan glycosyltransferase
MNTKNKSKVKKSSISTRLRNGMIVIFLIMILLIVRLGWLQFVKGSWLKEQMYSQLITSRIISPKRGTIYDANGKELAISAAVDTVTINPTLIVVSDENKELAEIKTKALKEKVAKALSEIFELDYQKTLEKVSSTNFLETIAKKVQKDKIDKLKSWMEEEKVYSGINIDEDSKRYYPYGNLASNLIGFCGDENIGLEGLENEFDDLLTGTPRKNNNISRCNSRIYTRSK